MREPFIRVEHVGRIFLVRFRPDGTAQAIKERHDNRGHIIDRTYWHHTRKITGRNTIVNRVLDAARAKCAPIPAGGSGISTTKGR